MTPNRLLDAATNGRTVKSRRLQLASTMSSWRWNWASFSRLADPVRCNHLNCSSLCQMIRGLFRVALLLYMRWSVPRIGADLPRQPPRTPLRGRCAERAVPGSDPGGRDQRRHATVFSLYRAEWWCGVAHTTYPETFGCPRYFLRWISWFLHA